MRQLREENGKLKQLVADLSLDKHILQEVLSKKVEGLPVAERVRWVQHSDEMSERLRAGGSGWPEPVVDIGAVWTSSWRCGCGWKSWGRHGFASVIGG